MSNSTSVVSSAAGSVSVPLATSETSDFVTPTPTAQTTTPTSAAAPLMTTTETQPALTITQSDVPTVTRTRPASTTTSSTSRTSSSGGASTGVIVGASLLLLVWLVRRYRKPKSKAGDEFYTPYRSPPTSPALPMRQPTSPIVPMRPVQARTPPAYPSDNTPATEEQRNIDALRYSRHPLDNPYDQLSAIVGQPDRRPSKPARSLAPRSYARRY